MEHSDLTQSNLIMDKVNANLNMPHAAMMNRIPGHVYCADIITVNNHHRSERGVELLEQLTKSTCLYNSVCHNPVFCLGAGERDTGLPFRIPRHQVVTKIDTVTQGRASRIWTTSPVSIRVGGETINRSSTKMKTSRLCALDIMKNPLKQCEMRFPRVMHKQTDLLNNIGSVRTSQCQVLESTGETAVVCRISDRRSIGGRKLHAGIN
jgi:hypothetical protein